MGQRGPLVTAIVVVGGLVGFMTANAAGGLVGAAPENAPPQPSASSQTAKPPQSSTSAQIPTSSQPPKTTVAPPVSEAPPEFPAEVVYAGRATDSPLAVAVAVKGTDAAAYLRDGANLEAWLKGSAANGKVDVASADGATRLTAESRGDTLTGEVTFNGTTQAFSIGVARAPAGIYRGEGADVTIGWIVLPDGTQVGILRRENGTGNGTGSDRSPAPPLDPVSGQAPGAPVTAEKVSGDTTFG